MPETIVYSREPHGLPYSKGLMAQSLSASGLAPDRAYELALIVERRLHERTGSGIAVADLNELVEEVLLEQVSEDAVRRFHEWQRLDRLDRPLIVLLAGSTGVGKSTLATMLAVSSGRSERRLITSASMPCFASCSAACSATPTMMPKATIVTRSPARSTFARPSGRMNSSSNGQSKVWP